MVRPPQGAKSSNSCTQVNQPGQVSSASLGRRRLQQGFNTPPPPATLPVSAVQQGMTPAQAGKSSGYFGSGPFLSVLNSTSAILPASQLGLKTRTQYVIFCPVSASGALRYFFLHCAMRFNLAMTDILVEARPRQAALNWLPE